MRVEVASSLQQSSRTGIGREWPDDGVKESVKSPIESNGGGSDDGDRKIAGERQSEIGDLRSEGLDEEEREELV